MVKELEIVDRDVINEIIRGTASQRMFARSQLVERLDLYRNNCVVESRSLGANGWSEHEVLAGCKWHLVLPAGILFDVPDNVTTITAMLDHMLPNPYPDFSITAEHANGGGGCSHELMHLISPRVFDRLIAMHLADIRGVPMHGIQDILYWWGHSDQQPWPWESCSQARNNEALAKRLRLPLWEVEKLPNIVPKAMWDDAPLKARALAAQDDYWTAADVKKFFDAQRVRWQQEALDAIDMMGGLY